MRRTLKRFYVATALVLVVAGLVTLSLLQPIFGTRTDFSVYNTRWNGASDLAQDVYGEGALIPAFQLQVGERGTTVAHRSFSAYNVDPGGATVLVVGPTKGPTEREATWLSTFVRGGGRLVVADDFGSGNAFAQAVGAETRFRGGLMLDLAFAKRPEFVVATDFRDHLSTEGVGEVVLDYATALSPGPNASVLALTESSAWIDRNGNQLKDPGEDGGPFPLLAAERVGRGEVLLLSDPSLLINGMRPIADNQALAQGVVAWSTQGDRSVLIDEAHRDYPDPVRFLGTQIQSMPQALRVGLALAALGVYLVFTLGEPGSWARAPREHLRSLVDRAFPEPPGERPDPVEVVLRRHPSWSKTALRDIHVDWTEQDEP